MYFILKPLKLFICIILEFTYTLCFYNNVAWLSSAIITGDTADEVYANVKDVIHDQSGPVVWIPSSDQLWTLLMPSVYVIMQLMIACFAELGVGH